MSDSGRNLAVGTFVLAGLAALAYLSFTVGGFSIAAPESMTLYATFDELGGLRERAPVTLSGVTVGEVTSMELDEDYRARVGLTLDAGLQLPIDTSASIVTAGVLGDRYVILAIGADELMLADGEDIDYTESAVILERLIGKFITQLGN